MKKLFISALGVCTTLTLVVSPSSIKATDFEGQEDKYMKICSSSNLSDSNVNTCREFNSYLKKKNSKLKSEIKDTKSEIADTSEDISEVTQKIASLNTKIKTKEKEINYLSLLPSIKSVEQ